MADNQDWDVLHVRVPVAHKERMSAVIIRRGDDYGAQAAFMRRAMETQLLIEEHINGVRDQPPLPRAILTLQAALATGLDVSHVPGARIESKGNAEAQPTQGNAEGTSTAADG